MIFFEKVLLLILHWPILFHRLSHRNQISHHKQKWQPNYSWCWLECRDHLTSQDLIPDWPLKRKSTNATSCYNDYHFKIAHVLTSPIFPSYKTNSIKKNNCHNSYRNHIGFPFIIFLETENLLVKSFQCHFINHYNLPDDENCKQFGGTP